MRMSTTFTANADRIPSSPRSILSQITAPFASRTRNLTEYYIRPDEPHRQYSPGDQVRGSVVLTVARPVRVTHLVLCLHGYVKVSKNTHALRQSPSTDGGFLGTGRGKRGSEYFGNGFAALFENEVALCGEGRLDVGVYEFKFELEFPSKGIPSSIDFERGTISYMLTSTLTRPTTINPTSSCNRKLYLVESIDIGPMLQPKPRVISLEPISKRSRTKNTHRKIIAGSDTRKMLVPLKNDQQDVEAIADPAGLRNSEEPPQSPAISEASSASAVSSSSQSFRFSSIQLHPKSTSGTETSSNRTSVADKTITATTELLHGGCLPGDVLPLVISINHTRPVKSVQGIIVTFYRLIRIETHPIMPLGPLQKDEDYLPKSRTGLGGLSLSSAGSSNVFRKDLGQTFTPLIVDPRSLTAIIRTSVRIPDDIIPTISCVPGAIISFKYYVEVVIDLRGKLANPTISNLHVMDSVISSASGQDFLDTDQIRREKSVVCCLFEVIVGTRDSKRHHIKRVERHHSCTISCARRSQDVDDTRADQSIEVVENANQNDDNDTSRIPREDALRDHDEQLTVHQVGRFPISLVPPPVVEENVDEKTRLRRAEQFLLPSAPPGDEESSSVHPHDQASAPILFDDNEQSYRQDYAGPSAPAYTGLLARYSRQNDGGIVVDDSAEAPTGSQDDKQEMERQRLILAASSPYDEEDELNGQQSQNIVPTAPIINEDYPYQSHESHPTSSSLTQHTDEGVLPLYQR